MLRSRASRRLLMPLAVAGLFAGTLTAGPAMAAPAIPTLVDVRAAHHTDYDRLVFEFSGDLPAHRSVAYVDEIIGDGSGKPVRVAGNAFLEIRFSMAKGHDDRGNITYGPARRAYALPNIMEVVNVGDFEAVMTFGVGLAKETPVSVSTLASPSRLVIDIDTSFSTVNVNDYFISTADGTLNPVAVSRPVIPPATAKGALQRLFAGPTQPELAAGLRFVNSGASGFTGLSIVDRVARVTLTGGCNSNGAATNLATELMLTLKQFSSITWVKIYDPSGHTERPTGNSDSIPFCLEP